MTAAIAAAAVSLAATSSARGGAQPSIPIRAAFYYPWFPETWKVGGKLTHYHPALGYYASADPKVQAAHLRALSYAGFDAAISSWQGPGHYTDTRLRSLLRLTVSLRSPVKWAVYDEHDPTGPVSTLVADLTYIRDHLAASPAYLRVGGRFVVFVYEADHPSCATVEAWNQANKETGGDAYIDLKVFPGYRSCAAQPASWHQYAPAEPLEVVPGHSAAVSPGFWKADESTPRLSRDPTRFTNDLRTVVASKTPWQLVTTFNEWGEGTAVEAAREWSSSSGEGSYLDILHRVFGATKPAATPEARPQPAKPKSKPKPVVTRPRVTTTTSSPTRGPLRIVGQPRVAVTLRVGFPASTSAVQVARFRYHWYVCDWTGTTCNLVGVRSRYRLRQGDLGKTVRLTLAPRKGAAAVRLGPTAIVLPATGYPTVAAAGDISCDPTASNFNGGRGSAKSCQELATSNLIIGQHPTAVLTLGDTQYECGDLSAYEHSFAPSWGRLKPIIHPGIGNHEYGKICHRNDPSGYFTYFGHAAGADGWYSYDVGDWHFIALDSECSYGEGRYSVGGCWSGSPQESWLRKDLASDHSACTLAYWHEPRFSSGEHGDAYQMGVVWNDLAAAHVDIVLSGHNHDYERFDPIGSTPPTQTQPNLDPSGIREFVVGTGGRNTYPFKAAPLTGEVIRTDNQFGALLLTLEPKGYQWRFEPLTGSGDQGSGTCH